MACCDQPPEGAYTAEVSFVDLPVETFCCMGRMAYTLTSTAVQELTGSAVPSYAQFDEAKKLDLGAQVKSIVTGEGFSAQSAFDRLFEKVVKTMVSAA